MEICVVAQCSPSRIVVVVVVVVVAVVAVVVVVVVVVHIMLLACMNADLHHYIVLCVIYIYIWGFPQMEVFQNGWFIWENPHLTWMITRGNPMTQETSMDVCWMFIPLAEATKSTAL